MNTAANDDARYHDFFSAIQRLHAVMELPLTHVSWLAGQVDAMPGGIEVMQVGQLLDLIAKARRRPVLVMGGA